MLVMSAIIGSEKTVDEQEKNFLTEAEIEKFLVSHSHFCWLFPTS
jgi:hypothetical protein